MTCNDAVAALVESIENGTPLSDENREHLRECDRCGALLASAKELQTLMSADTAEVPAIEAPVEAAQREVVHASRKKVFLVAAAALLVIVSAATVILSAYFSGGQSRTLWGLGDAEVVLLFGVLLLVGVPAVAIVWLVRASRHSTAPLYKRLKPGRQLSGVCLGLAERFNLNVTIVRLAFLVGFFFDGLGFWLYILLDLAMPVHPADREHLLRFRIQRWMDRRAASRG